jgi:hypothetical protein
MVSNKSCRRQSSYNDDLCKQRSQMERHWHRYFPVTRRHRGESISQCHHRQPDSSLMVNSSSIIRSIDSSSIIQTMRVHATQLTPELVHLWLCLVGHLNSTHRYFPVTERRESSQCHGRPIIIVKQKNKQRTSS